MRTALNRKILPAQHFLPGTYEDVIEQKDLTCPTLSAWHIWRRHWTERSYLPNTFCLAHMKTSLNRKILPARRFLPGTYEDVIEQKDLTCPTLSAWHIWGRRWTERSYLPDAFCLAHMKTSLNRKILPAGHFLPGTYEDVIEQKDVSHFTWRPNLLHDETVINQVPCRHPLPTSKSHIKSNHNIT